MKINVDKRTPEAGFVMVDNRRMLFAPVRTHTPTENPPLVLTTGNWGELTMRQRMACKAALQDEYPDRDIFLGL